MQKNLDYWFGLKLWPLDAACRLVCDADPNNADQAPIQMPDPTTRLEWVNLFHHATADDEVEIIEGKGEARGVNPAAFIEWARSKGRGLDAKFDALIANSKPTVKRETVTQGITKGAVINAFGGLHFDRGQWTKALGKNIPDWLMACRVSSGKQGSKVSATWNPVLIAAALIDKQIPINKLNGVFVHLKVWADEWREVSASFRD